MATKLTRDYSSRKFIVTLLGMFLCAGIAIFAMLMKVDPSPAALMGINIIALLERADYGREGCVSCMPVK